METLFDRLYHELQAGQPAVLLTVVASQGSTPRGIGSHQAVFAEGTTAGTVGGGYQEYLAIQAGKQCLAQQQSAFRRLILHPNDEEDINAACGGELTVFCQYLDPAEPGLLDLLSAILQALRQQTASWLALDVSDERQWGMALVREGAVQGCGQMGSLQAVDAAWCRQNVAGMASDGQRRWYSEPLAYPGRVFIFGGGHVSQALVPVLVSIGFSCTVVDDRAEFADPALFPQAEAVYEADYEALPADLGVTPDDYVCIMTRGHVGDYDVQRQMLAIKPYYLGVIGSRRKLAFVKEKLLADGFTAAEIDACHAPIGLAISAVTPAEIAISIAAELIAIRAKREGREKSRYHKP
ncbi:MULTISPECIES: XdhC/CoxI family protein [Megasphaera]|uniref:XdhC family protein n=1 Tax=Megasphaera TaxID=906 RepID=UPI0006C7CC3F|nr:MULTISPECIES: XdhC/CoxI family protein [Megasphaera]ALG41700.1 hypothetical protein AZ49_03615 [Megasphaera elsdenii 14-14]MDY5215406.1 XdhC family protein [Megasphaera elsdenii]